MLRTVKNTNQLFMLQKQNKLTHTESFIMVGEKKNTKMGLRKFRGCSQILTIENTKIKIYGS